MQKRGKKYRLAQEKVEHLKQYPLEEAVSLIKQASSAKFDESVDISNLV